MLSFLELCGHFSNIDFSPNAAIEPFVLDNKEEGMPKERVIEKLQRKFELSKDRAEYYYDKFVEEEKLMVYN